jgi:shikimate 5-dehydrogenase
MCGGSSSPRNGSDSRGSTSRIPVKQTVIPFLDALSPSATLVGAVNTVVFDGDRAIGHNTDVTGFGAALDDALAGSRLGSVILVGAGGAGAAVASALVERGIDLVIVDVDTDRAASLAGSVGVTATGRVSSGEPRDLAALIASADGIVNATPFGMAGHPGAAFDLDLLSERLFVADIVYRPRPRRHCSLPPVHAVAASCRASAWPCTRRPTRSRSSPENLRIGGRCSPISTLWSPPRRPGTLPKWHQ